ncbi:Winged helix-turn-helix DNA-binding [Micromonospora yangpuensis]|uniref:Winged helix-turn-helix DNA-binding n=1 Tax=Micromonospora yangpuensis TaxID=683228 RepID=A0A1C6U8E1_9ACTN|nr:Winged helix-turn-helix DNA-binding [Micromonospora yangpuensis]
MLISSSVWQRLNEIGVTLVPVGPDRVELGCAGVRDVFTVVATTAPLHPGDIAVLTGRHPEACLVIVPTATSAVRGAVERANWSLLVGAEQQVEGFLNIGGRRIAVNGRGAGDRRRGVRPGRVPWGTYTLLRRLVDCPMATQQELARLVGISQPRVSQALRALGEHGLVCRASTGWQVPDVEQALRWWLRNYPGPGGITTFWYSLDPPREQAYAIAALNEHGPAGLAVSGDIAADLLAPWRSPQRAVLYTRGGLDLTETGFTPAGEEEATLELTVPRDPGVWAGPDLPGPGAGELPLADPMQILWDLNRAPGTDVEEAVERLWNVMLRQQRGRAA